MRIALFSDVHGNLPAFEAVLADIEKEGVDARWCLGDLVGYGAQPNECVALAKESCDLCLIGNHDLVVTGKLSIEEFSMNAAIAATWTKEHIGQDALDYLTKLEPADESHAIGLYHASPRDPVWEYVLSALLAELCLDTQRQRVALIGHSHVALSFVRPEGDVATGQARRDGDDLDVGPGSGEWLLNPGSVGQPRDGDPRAAYAVIDTDAGTVTFYRASYRVDETQRRIRARGLPEMFADRLAFGV